jgi:hypothetical protein
MTNKKEWKQQVRRAKIVHLQLRLLPIVLPISVVLLVVATVLSVTSLFQLRAVKSNTTRIDRARGVLHDSEIRACERVNMLRRRVNENGSIIYRVLKAASTSNSSQAAAYSFIIASVEYASPTDCEMAVTNPRGYKRPPNIKFSVLERQGRYDVQTGEIKPKGEGP